MLARFLLIAGFILSTASSSRAHEVSETSVPDLFDRKGAIAFSQAAIGRRLDDLAFTDQDGNAARLSQFDGKPLVISLIYTACSQSCPVLIEYLADAVDVAQEALGEDSFAVITVGFDSNSDSPERLRAYAASHGIDQSNWLFLSGDHNTVDRLMESLSFIQAPSPQGFEHIAQISVVDSQRRVFSHVYGATFEPPALVAPLKALLSQELSYITDLADVIERVRLFCTLYDPASGRYAFDYSIFISLAVGGMMLLGLATILVRTFMNGRPPKGAA